MGAAAATGACPGEIPQTSLKTLFFSHICHVRRVFCTHTATRLMWRNQRRSEQQGVSLRVRDWIALLPDGGPSWVRFSRHLSLVEFSKLTQMQHVVAIKKPCKTSSVALNWMLNTNNFRLTENLCVCKLINCFFSVPNCDRSWCN